MTAMSPLRVHASAVAIGEAGILIRGPSGAGKSSLALALIALAQLQGRFARLIADPPLRWDPSTPRGEGEINTDLFPRDEYYLNNPVVRPDGSRP